jgi:hypothetical protein
MMTRALARNFAVIIRLDRTIQYAAAGAGISVAGDDWIPDGACHRAARRADPVAGMTREI